MKVTCIDTIHHDIPKFNNRNQGISVGSILAFFRVDRVASEVSNQLLAPFSGEQAVSGSIHVCTYFGFGMNGFRGAINS